VQQVVRLAHFSLIDRIMTSSTTLSDDLLSQLRGGPMQQISQQLGTDSAQTESAVSAALPMLLGTLGQNASQPQGAQALFGSLQNNFSASPDLGNLLGSLLGGGAAQSGAGNILGQIFGGNQSRAEESLGKATGLSGNSASELLKILAPIVMSFLAQRMQGQQLDAGGLSAALGQERDAARQQGGAAGGLLGSLLDQDGDGQVGLNDLLKIGGSLFGKR
jgi:hypothetical protein